jgi:hypothetical protein
MTGAVAGTPGTLPSNWTNELRGLTREIIGTGTENGVTYIDIKLSGTSTATENLLWRFDNTTQIGATTSQAWTHSVFVKIVSSTAVPSVFNLVQVERTALGVATASAILPITPTTTLTRFSYPRTTSGVGTERIEGFLNAPVTNGASYDFTIRIGWPQMETGSVATSPIVTTAGTANRAADVVSLTGASSLIGQTEGTLFVETELPSYNIGANSSCLLAVNVNGASDIFTNAIFIGCVAGSVNQPRFRVSASGSNTADIQMSANRPAGIYKFAGAYASNDAAFYANGAQVGTDSSVTVGANAEIYIGYSPVTARQQVCWIRFVALFPTRLANASLATLTTL